MCEILSIPPQLYSDSYFFLYSSLGVLLKAFVQHHLGVEYGRALRLCQGETGLFGTCYYLGLGVSAIASLANVKASRGHCQIYCYYRNWIVTTNYLLLQFTSSKVSFPFISLPPSSGTTSHHRHCHNNPLLNTKNCFILPTNTISSKANTTIKLTISATTTAPNITCGTNYHTKITTKNPTVPEAYLL